SFFDKTRFSSPGKKLMGLTVLSETGKRVKMSQAFLRGALTLLGLATFGLVHLLDLQSRLSDTKVVKK
ncbi:MAG: RDD family protein, partial [Bacteriovoracaceae bacterium]